MFSQPEKERLVVLLNEFAGISEAGGNMILATQAEHDLAHRDAELLRRLAGEMENGN